MAISAERAQLFYGRVVDASTEKALPYANILLKNTDYRTSTDSEGDFRIPVQSMGSKLVVSFIGYKTKEVEAVPADSSVLIRLTPKSYVTKEVKVIADEITNRMQNTIHLGSAAMKILSGITRDPLRALQLMPGTSSNDEASSRIDVRGGTWDENTVFIDGAEIYDPYHLRELSLASLSIFNMDVVKDIDFSAGGFGARYGDALSSVTSVHYKEGNRKHFEGNVNLSPLDLSACLQGPIGANASFIVAARGSYLGYVLKNLDVSPDIYGGYYDVQGDIAYHADESSRVQLDFLFSGENVTQSPFHNHSEASFEAVVRGMSTVVTDAYDQTQSFAGRYMNSLLSCSYNKTLAPGFQLNTLFYATFNTGHENPIQDWNTSTSYAGLPDLWQNRYNTASEKAEFLMNVVSLGESITYDPAPFLAFSAGATVKRIRYGYDPKMFNRVVSESNVIAYPDTTSSTGSAPIWYEDTLSVNAQTYQCQAFLQPRLTVSDNLVITPGIRFDYFQLNGEGEFSPRLNLWYRALLGVELTAAWGVYYQTPAYNQIYMTGPSVSDTRFQEATHYILGVEKRLSPDMDIRVDLYEKYYSHLIPAVRSPYGGLCYDLLDNNGVGYAKGFDFGYTMKLGNLELLLSYGYLVAKEKSGQETSYHPRFSDQRNTASIAIVYRPWERWTIDLRAYYGSGYAYTPLNAVLDSAAMVQEWLQSGDNSAHYPAYERVDLRVERNFTVLDNPLQMFIDVTNLLNRKNVWGYDYTLGSNGSQRQTITLPGIVPAIGVSYKFGG